MSAEAIYTGLKDFINLGLAATVSGDLDTTLKVEIAKEPYGEDWTGIRMSKLPTATAQKKYVSGGGKVAYTYQLVSKQAIDHTETGAIAYSTYLDSLTGELRRLFRGGQRPILPDGMTLDKVEAVQQATLNFADGTYSGYVLDLRFTITVRSL